MKRTKIFLDAEFTGLHQQTTLISLALISENNKIFYAEFTDFDRRQIDEWLSVNVVNKLNYLRAVEKRENRLMEREGHYVGTTSFIREKLELYLSQFEQVEIWSDTLAYDWMLFCQLWGGALHIPRNVYYIPFDLSTLMYVRGVDPDIDRLEFALQTDSTDPAYIEKLKSKLSGEKHNALNDTRLIQINCGKLL